MGFAERLFELREYNEFTQKKLASLLNLKASAVSKYEKERSQPGILTIIKIAEVFNVSIDYLLGVSSVKNPYTKENFTPGECELITRYRKLSKENKIRIDERINVLLDGQR